MKPENSKERRSALLSFSVLVLLTSLPLCIASFLIARTETVELDFLREKYKDQRSEQDQSNDHIRSMDDVNKVVKQFRDAAIEMSIDTYNYGTLQKLLTNLEDENRQLQPKGQVDSLHYNLALDVQKSLSQTNELLKEADQEIEDLRESINELERDKKDLEKMNDELKRQIP